MRPPQFHIYSYQIQAAVYATAVSTLITGLSTVAFAQYFLHGHRDVKLKVLACLSLATLLAGVICDLASMSQICRNVLGLNGPTALARVSSYQYPQVIITTISGILSQIYFTNLVKQELNKRFVIFVGPIVLILATVAGAAGTLIAFHQVNYDEWLTSKPFSGSDAVLYCLWFASAAVLNLALSAILNVRVGTNGGFALEKTTNQFRRVTSLFLPFLETLAFSTVLSLAGLIAAVVACSTSGFTAAKAVAAASALRAILGRSYALCLFFALTKAMELEAAQHTTTTGNSSTAVSSTNKSAMVDLHNSGANHGTSSTEKNIVAQYDRM